MAGTKKLNEASKIKNEANYRYNNKRERFNAVESDINNSLKNLGRLKAEIWNSFEGFVKMYERIQNKPEIDEQVSSESIILTKDELNNIKGVALTFSDVVKNGAGAIGAGGLIGIATSGGLASSVTVASTGTAMSTLSGVAATNATLAAFGGGSIASGGLGMAGGATVLGGLIFAPIVAIVGIILNFKGSSSLDNAHDISDKADEAIDKMNESEKLLKKVKKLSEAITIELKNLNKVCVILLSSMESIVSNKNKRKWRNFIMTKQHSKQFKEDAVHYYENHKELGQKGCAKSLGIGESTLTKRLKQFREKGKSL